MNKSAIKKYAVWARNELIDRVKRRAALYEISDKGYGNVDADSVLGRPMSDEEKQQRKALIARIDKNGYEFVIEEVAYTWFNRFAALRFMEVNGCLPSRVRVFTDEDNTFKPQILTEAINLDGILDGLDMQRVYELKNEDNKDALFKYLIIVQCNALSRILPGMFQKINDYTELLFPDNLLREGSAIQRMIEWIPEEDWTDQVQIIGWLYQYYNTEPKDKVFSRPSGQKITKQEIPAATQLFTPRWIVRYMVENSLGRLWLDHCKAESGLSDKKMNASYFEWTYYLEEAEQEPEVEKQLEAIRKEYASLKPEDIRVIDPCMGSGHILCYLFDVLVQIYESYGYPAREAVRLILEKNLYGLDLDERAQQLAYFAVMMKAWRYDHRFFSRNKDENGDPIVPQPHLGHFQDLSLKPENFSDPALQSLVKAFENADEYGSLLEINDLDIEAAANAVDAYTDNFLTGLDAREKLLRMVKLARILSQKYDVVVTNPPYMGSSNMYDRLNKFIKEHYADYKSDFFSAFIVRISKMTKAEGYCGFFTPYVWMFILSYYNLRQYLYNRCTIETLIQFEYSAFEEATVPVCTFAFKNSRIEGKKGAYLRLTDFRGGMEVQRQKTLEAIGNHQCGFYYEQTSDNFAKIPGAPVAYWVNSNWFAVFENYPVMRDVCVLKKGTSTGDNKRFIRQWYEVNIGNIFFEAHTPDEAMQSQKRWFPINGGGERRKWYGNRIDIVNWESDGKEMKSLATKLNHGGHWSRYIINPDRFFTECIGWSAISSSKISARYIGYGFAFSSAAMEAFEANLKYLMALINSVVADDILDLLAPTLNFGVEQIGKIPLILDRVEKITEITEQNISLSRTDWDSFETSWDFQRHPLIEVRKEIAFGQFAQARMAGANSISECYREWETQCEARFQHLKANEEKLNRIFIDIYGLQGELTPEVEDKDVTVRKADLQRDIKSLISYAVGCMFGRYSLYKDGLIFAGEPYSLERWVEIMNDQPGIVDAEELQRAYRNEGVVVSEMFFPDTDGIIPITDDEYFSDDIVTMFVNFIETVYGRETLENNLKFIAEALGKKGSPREVIRNYFLNDFFNDHCKIYQKRPIYWLFDSGKKNGFKCLIYLHRYRPDTIARIRTDYVHEQQSRYRTAMADLEKRISAASTSERVKFTKLLDSIKGQADELRAYEEKIHHLADMMIPLDLDDGVKVNYAKFGDVLAKIK